MAVIYFMLESRVLDPPTLSTHHNTHCLASAILTKDMFYLTERNDTLLLVPEAPKLHRKNLKNSNVSFQKPWPRY